MKWNWVGDQGIQLVLASEINEDCQNQIQKIYTNFRDFPEEHLQELVVGYSQIVFLWSKSTRIFSKFQMEELVQKIKKRVDECLSKEEEKINSKPTSVISIPTIYNGPDLKFVADYTGCSVNELIERHAPPLYRFFLFVFLPGFAFLGVLDKRIH